MTKVCETLKGTEFHCENLARFVVTTPTGRTLSVCAQCYDAWTAFTARWIAAGKPDIADFSLEEAGV